MGIEVDGANQKLILDSDGDTYLEAATDDTVKVYVSGAEDLRIGANAINVLSGTTLTIDSGATITNSGTANGFSSADPSSADGDTLGTASAEWSDLYLADGGVIYFGNDQEITLTHNADDGLLLKHVGTGDGKEPSLTFQAGDNDIAQDDVLGSIFFQAPDEGAGTDAVLVAAGIEAVSEGDFSSSNNATKLSFKTAASEAAAEKMTLSSGGNLDVTGDITGSTINADADTSSGDNAAIGYTSTEGLILTGQGSSYDVTIKNDADTIVCVVPTGADDLQFLDNAKCTFGTGSDLLIYHDGSNSIIHDDGAGDLKVMADNDLRLQKPDGTDYIRCITDGAVQLNHNGSIRLTTVSDGINVGGSADGYIHCSDEHLYFKTDAAKHHIFQTNGANERLRITSAGRILIGTDDYTVGASSGHFVINFDASATNAIKTRDSDGNAAAIHNIFVSNASVVGTIKTSTSATQYNTSSDYRLKENETAITDGIDRVKQLKPYRFNFKVEPDKTLDGFMAHEVSGIVPEAISGEKDAMHPEVLYTADDELPEGKNIGDVKEATKINPQGIDQAKLVPLLTSALQEAITKIETLEAKVAVLEG